MSRVLWLSWKDHAHPKAGGAELVMLEISKRLVAEGHRVTVLTAGYDGASERELLDGIEHIRVGKNRYTHNFQAMWHYLRQLRGNYDIVIEAVNTAPYFAPLFGPGKHTGRRPQFFLFYHQLAREIWHYETPFPLNVLGYNLLEPASTRMLGRSSAKVITVSNSTKQDLVKNGFNQDAITIISEGIAMQPLESIEQVAKYERPTMLSLGAMRAMKQTLHQIKAFEAAKQRLPELQMKIVGSSDGEYGEAVCRYIERSPYRHDIEYLGRVPHAQKMEVMRRSHVVAVTSIKEGWCLVVTEANSQGTPAVAYDADGLRDSIRHGDTGLLAPKNQPAELANQIVKLLEDQPAYERLRHNAWHWSRQITFDKCYEDFRKVVQL